MEKESKKVCAGDATPKRTNQLMQELKSKEKVERERST